MLLDQRSRRTIPGLDLTASSVARTTGVLSIIKG